MKEDKKRTEEIAKMEQDNKILFARVNDIYQIIAKNGVKISMTKEEADNFYENTVKEILSYFLDNKLKLKDIWFLLKREPYLDPIYVILSMLENSFSMSMELSNAKKWNKKLEDVTFDEIDNLLK